MSKKFVNAVVPVFNANHINAVINEALRLGYRLDRTCPSYKAGTFSDSIECIHLEPSGKIYGYRTSSAEALIASGNPQNLYSEAVLLKKLHKLRDLDFKLNHPSVESQDNLAVLAVIPRPKYEVVAPVTPVEYLRGAGVPSDLICAPYGSNEFPECVCLGVDANTRKTCRMVKAYGDTCGKPFAKLQKATQEDKDKVIEWVRPKAENPIVNEVVRWSVLATSKIVSVVKRAFNFLRGNK